MDEHSEHVVDEIAINESLLQLEQLEGVQLKQAGSNRDWQVSHICVVDE